MTKLLNGSIVVFSLISIVLGAMAYFVPREGHDPSLVSLIAGCGIGLLMLGSLWLWTKNPRAGRITSVVLCLVCLIRFVPAWLSKGFYPNGLMALLAGALMVLLIVGHLQASAAKAGKGA